VLALTIFLVSIQIFNISNSKFCCLIFITIKTLFVVIVRTKSCFVIGYFIAKTQLHKYSIDWYIITDIGI